MRFTVVSFRLFLLAFVLAMPFPTASGQDFGTTNRQPALAASAKVSPVAAGLSSLPADAQTAISAALGRRWPDYYAQPRGSGFQMTNPGQALTAQFRASGVELRNHNDVWSLSPREYGYGSALKPVDAGVATASLNRVEYRRGGLTEWYANGPTGIEQGFTINERPAASRDGIATQPLTFALALGGDLAIERDPDRKGLTLSSNAGTPLLRYAGLAAADSRGRDLPAWLEVQGKRLLIRVDDAGASYPVVIDPLMQLAELTVSGSGNGWEVGSAVSVSGGNTVVVGACGGGALHQGTAYIFVEPSSGWQNMTQTAELTASDGVKGDEFGCSASINANTVVIGAPGATVNQNAGQGAAYLFVEPPGGWQNMSETAKLTSSDGLPGDSFGFSCTVFGGMAVVGAAGQNGEDGGAYVYVRPPTGWATTSAFNAKLTPANQGGVVNFFGSSVATNGTTVVVGAPQVDGTFLFVGAVYVFVKPAGGWKSATQTAELTASDAIEEDFLGTSVAISGSTIVAGAPQFNGIGRVYVFVEPAGGWVNATQTAELDATDKTAHHVGNSVAINAGANLIVTGAPDALVGSNKSQGAVYVFAEPVGGWTNMTQTSRLTASDGQANSQFGWSVAITGQTMVAGAPEAEGSALAGSAYVF